MYIITTPAISDTPEVAGTAVKQKPGQAGHDGQHRLRTRRVETRVSPDEHAAICARAMAHNFNSVAQYVREQAMHSSGDLPSSQHKALIACQAELNDMAEHVNQVARHLTKGEPLDEEMLMVMLQVLDLAEERVKQSNQDTAEAV